MSPTWGGLTDQKQLHFIANWLDKRPAALTDNDLKEISETLRRIAGALEPDTRAGHRSTCPSLLISKPGKCNCEAPYGAGGL